MAWQAFPAQKDTLQPFAELDGLDDTKRFAGFESEPEP